MILKEGTYKAVGCWYKSLSYDGSKALTRGTNGDDDPINVNFGDFGASDPEIASTTGQTTYNVEFKSSFEDRVFAEYGVISEDGLTITLKGMMGTATLTWITDEEAKALEEDGDPIEAPPGPYKIQPENQGRILWITGSPGLGKSTTAQFLGRTAGFVYYEADCFGSCRNPYIPLDAENPSLAQVRQRPLKGEGLAKRRLISNRMGEIFGKIIKGEDFDVEAAKEFYGAMCDDISREKKRIGGNFAVAAVTLKKEIREHIKYFYKKKMLKNVLLFFKGPNWGLV